MDAINITEILQIVTQILNIDSKCCNYPINRVDYIQTQNVTKGENMTNKLLLKKHMKNNNYSVSSMAKAMGINRITLLHKINGEYGFWAREIEAIKELLDLSHDETCEIFFARTDTKCNN